MKRTDFGNNFHWGVAIAAQQNEGARNEDGRTDSIWDVFSEKKGKIKDKDIIGEACHFYHQYMADLQLAKKLGFTSFRFSISWSRILPDGTGIPNMAGINFYHRVIDACLALGLEPFVTLYHWDLPAILEEKGGWTSYKMPEWFACFARTCAMAFGGKVKYWMVLNEPLGFTSLGYLLGQHAPGKRDLHAFFSAVHNAMLAQAIGGRILRECIPDAHIGTTFSCSDIIPYTQHPNDIAAAAKVNAIVNRLFIEPALGLGYPQVSDFPLLQKMEIYNYAWRYKEQMKFDFDFIGLQNYFPLVVKHNALIPYIHASEVKAKDRNRPYTSMGWEINSDSFARIIRQFASYKNVRQIMITENGAAFKDQIKNREIKDKKRTAFFKQYLAALKTLMEEGVPVSGYFVWTLLDNFEWNYGYFPKFGLAHKSKDGDALIIKSSGYWFQSFLTK